jgi:hypothetical protein
MSVPGDAGYEVERFVGKSCETCRNGTLEYSCDECDAVNGNHTNWMSKPATRFDCSKCGFGGALEGQAFLETECYRCDEYPKCGGIDIPDCMVEAEQNKREIPQESKLASPIGETVLTEEEKLKAQAEAQKSFFGGRFSYTLPDWAIRDSIAKAQDAHTRSELIKQGWKSPEEVKEILKTLKQLGDNPDFTAWRSLKGLIRRLEG